MEFLDQNKAASLRKLIIAVSIVIPLVVGVLFRVRIDVGRDMTFLPSIYAFINGLTAISLVAALVAIKKQKRDLHRSLVRFALALSLLFLVLYVLYHMTSDSTLYGDSNQDGKVDILESTKTSWTVYPYYFLLISHVLLSMAVIPLVLFAYLKAWSGNFEGHKKMVRFAFPIWLYVAISGVVVYFLISPFY
jgi:putative membrane protein